MDEAALQDREALAMSKTTLYAELKAGRLSSVQRGRSRLIPADAMAAYVELLKAEMRRIPR